jgi:hemerythrin
MEFFEWDDTYSVNIPEIDLQHMEFIRLINRIHEEIEKIKQGRVKGEDSIQSLVDEITETISAIDAMIEYANYHFSAEEKQMLQHNDPSYDAQKKAHKHFIEKVLKMKRDIDRGGGVDLMSVASFTKDWLANHILQMDKATFLPSSKM